MRKERRVVEQHKEEQVSEIEQHKQKLVPLLGKPSLAKFVMAADDQKIRSTIGTADQLYLRFSDDQNIDALIRKARSFDSDGDINNRILLLSYVLGRLKVMGAEQEWQAKGVERLEFEIGNMAGPSDAVNVAKELFIARD